MKSISGAVSTSHIIRNLCVSQKFNTLACMDLYDALNLLDIFSVMELNQNFLFMGKVTVAENFWLTPKQNRIFSSTCWCFAFYLLGCNLREFRAVHKRFPYTFMYQSPAQHCSKNNSIFLNVCWTVFICIMEEVYRFPNGNVALCLPS